MGMREKIVERAHNLLGFHKYHAFHCNCEHFATFCVTGVAVSSQTDSEAMAQAARLRTVLDTETATVAQTGGDFKKKQGEFKSKLHAKVPAKTGGVHGIRGCLVKVELFGVEKAGAAAEG